MIEIEKIKKETKKREIQETWIGSIANIIYNRMKPFTYGFLGQSGTASNTGITLTDAADCLWALIEVAERCRTRNLS